MSQPDVEYTEQDEADLQQLYSEEDGGPSFHTVLQVWRDVLEPAAAEALKRPTPLYCARMVAAHQEVRFRDVPELHRRYFEKLADMKKILDAEIASDPNCLSYDKAEDDARENAEHYKNLLLLWQTNVLGWEQAWDPTDEHAAVELAAIAETHKIFLGEQGIVAYLDQINFEYTEADQGQLAEALGEFQLGEG